jgi:hypothetical protein
VSKDHKLTISAVAREDRGEYICTALNTEGESRQTLSLNVLCTYDFIYLVNNLKVPLLESLYFSDKPVVVLRRKAAADGSSGFFSLSCSVEANPPAQVMKCF